MLYAHTELLHHSCQEHSEGSFLPRSSPKTPTRLAVWNSFYPPRKDEGLSRPCRDLRLWLGQAELPPAQRLHHEAIPRGIEYLSLPVLDGQLHRDPQPLPVTRGLGDVIADFFGGLRRTETLETKK